jgi:hypothetical protein
LLREKQANMSALVSLENAERIDPPSGRLDATVDDATRKSMASTIADVFVASMKPSLLRLNAQNDDLAALRQRVVELERRVTTRRNRPRGWR